jgi:hypothetical protein
MGRNKGEFQLSTLDRFYPFHVAVLVCRESKRGRFVFYGELDAAYRAMNEAPWQRSIGRGETEHVIFGFKTEEAAQTFHDRFGGFRIEPTDKARRQAEEWLRVERAVKENR